MGLQLGFDDPLAMGLAYGYVLYWQYSKMLSGFLGVDRAGFGSQNFLAKSS
jgi:hypothetical protein